MQNLKLEFNGKELILSSRGGYIQTGSRICLHQIDLADIFIMVEVKLKKIYGVKSPLYVELEVFTSYTSQEGDSKYLKIPIDNLDTFPDIYQKCMEEVMASLYKRLADTEKALLLLRTWL